jgi:hypothetical protein
MNARIRERTGVPLAPVSTGVGRVFVIRRTALGYQVLARHPYGRVSRLEPVGEAATAVGRGFASAEAVAHGLAREVLRREPGPGAACELARLLSGSGPRWELGEDEIRAALARDVRAA